jgi:anti-repressor protein
MDTQSNAIPEFTIKAVSIASGSINTVNARDLHKFLGVGRRFQTWIKDRIAEYGFIDGVDFIVLQSLVSQNGEIKRGGDRRSFEYAISTDMAKELAMVERTEKGRQIRRYFIECEKTLHQNHNNLFLEIARHEALLASATDRASNAGRELRFQGRIVKPALREGIAALIRQLQPELIGLEQTA